MLYLAVSQAVVAVAFACVLAQFLRNHAAEKRSHARREDALLDRLLHATGKTWTPPPADLEEWKRKLLSAQEDRREAEVEFMVSPEQFPSI